MPWSVAVDYICPDCGKPFQSTHYRRPARCPVCKKAYRAKRSLINYHQRKAEGRAYDKKRDPAYDDVQLGAPPSVYASGCVIHLRREVAACRCCRKVTDIINGYCEVCRSNGANEAQCHDASEIA
jgi:hypothetical protein